MHFALFLFHELSLICVVFAHLSTKPLPTPGKKREVRRDFAGLRIRRQK
ncbi:MAG TPA: hypothetical protein VFV38_46820 [Ktedonobacteraceae bacterium]|nr:hypothetical protein [Ktedonobacteraceae bacterium]